MKERAQENVGMVKKQAGVVNYEVEDLLWKQNVLGEETPDQLRNTIGGSKGGHQGRVPPLGVQILSFSCSFRQKCEK